MANYNRIWSKDKVKEEIHKRYLEKKSLNSGDLIKEDNALYCAARVQFGSWKNALNASNIDYCEVMKKKSWTNESIVNTIKELHGKGIDLSTKNVKVAYRPLYMAASAKNHYNSWREAVCAAGINYDSYIRIQFWDKEKIVEKIISLYDAGEDLSTGNVLKKYNPLFCAASHERYFGSWKRALEAAGIDYSKVTKHIFWSEQIIIQRIIELYDSGEDLSDTSIQANHPTFYGIIRKHFGSIEKGINAAGFNYDDIRKDSIFEARLGRYFEQYLVEMFMILGDAVDHHKINIFESEKCEFDFYDRKRDVYLEAKIASSTGSIEASLVKYLKYVPKLEIIYLKGKPRKSKDPRVKYVNVKSFYPRLIEVNGNDLIKKFELLKHGVVHTNNKIMNLDNY